MKLYWKKISKSCVPLGIIYSAISVMLAAAALAAQSGCLGSFHCVFKAVFGIPCPTCGITRSLAAISHFDFAAAFRFNPMVFIALLIIWTWGLFSLYGFGSGKGVPIIEVNRTPAIVLKAFFISALIANWAYLIGTGI